jgi:hypothetical protein
MQQVLQNTNKRGIGILLAAAAFEVSFHVCITTKYLISTISHRTSVGNQ